MGTTNIKHCLAIAAVGAASLSPTFGQDELSWNRACKTYRQKVKTFHFADAYGAINNISFAQSSFEQACTTMLANARRLMEWKTTLINDLNGQHYLQSIKDKFGIRYQGIEGATEQTLLVKVTYGTVELPWTKFRPETLIAVAASFIRKGSVGATRREALYKFATTEIAHPAVGVPH